MECCKLLWVEIFGILIEVFDVTFPGSKRIFLVDPHKVENLISEFLYIFFGISWLINMICSTNSRNRGNCPVGPIFRDKLTIFVFGFCLCLHEARNLFGINLLQEFRILHVETQLCAVIFKLMDIAIFYPLRHSIKYLFRSILVFNKV